MTSGVCGVECVRTSGVSLKGQPTRETRRLVEKARAGRQVASCGFLAQVVITAATKFSLSTTLCPPSARTNRTDSLLSPVARTEFKVMMKNT